MKYAIHPEDAAFVSCVVIHRIFSVAQRRLSLRAISGVRLPLLPSMSVKAHRTEVFSHILFFFLLTLLFVGAFAYTAGEGFFVRFPRQQSYRHWNCSRVCRYLSSGLTSGAAHCREPNA